MRLRVIPHGAGGRIDRHRACPVAPAQYRSKLLHRCLEGLGQCRRIGRRQPQDHRGTPAPPTREQVETQPCLIGMTMVEEGEIRLGEAKPPIAAAGLRLAGAGNAYRCRLLCGVRAPVIPVSMPRAGLVQATQLAQPHRGPKGRTGWQGLEVGGHGVVQGPQRRPIAGRGDGVVRLHDVGKVAQRHQALGEDVIDPRLGVLRGERRGLEPADPGPQGQHAALIAVEGLGEFAGQVEPGGVFALQGNEIARKTQIVTDQNFQPDGQLEGHGLVIGGAQAQRRDGLAGVVPGEVQGAKEHAALVLHGILFAADLEVAPGELGVQGVEQVAVLDRHPGCCARGCGVELAT